MCEYVSLQVGRKNNLDLFYEDRKIGLVKASFVIMQAGRVNNNGCINIELNTSLFVNRKILMSLIYDFT